MKILEKIKRSLKENWEIERDSWKDAFKEMWKDTTKAAEYALKPIEYCIDSIPEMIESTFDFGIKALVPALILLPFYCYRNEIDDALIHRSRPWMSIERERTFNSREESWDKFQVTLSSREKGKNLSDVIVYNDRDEIKFSKRIDSEKAVISFKKKCRSYWTEPSIYLQVIDEEGNMNYRYFGKAWGVDDIELKTIPTEKEEK